MYQKLVEWFSVGEHHLRWFDPKNDARRVAPGTGQAFMSGYFEAAVGAPNVFVSAGYENRLPNTQMFSGAALLPVCDGELCRLESPRCLLFPAHDVGGFLLAILVIVGSLSLLCERCEYLLFAVDDFSTGRAVDHCQFPVATALRSISDDCYPRE